MKKFFMSIAFVLVLAGVAAAGIIYLPRDLSSNKPKPSSAATVLEVISDKIEETSDTFAKCASGQATASSSGKVSATGTSGFSKEGIEEYLWLNQLSSRIVFAVDYLAENATTENGYANGFEYNKVYMGPLNTDGYDGVVYIKTETVTDGVNMYFDFLTTEDGMEVGFIISMHADYDFEKNEVKKIKMNYQFMPLMSELWAVEYDFVNKNFRGFQVYDWRFSHTLTEANEIQTAYNNGTLNGEKLVSYAWTHATMVSGNITDNINNLSFNAYEYWDDGWNDDHESASLVVVNNFYNTLYNSLRSFKLRDEMIVSNDVHLVNYVQDCVDYGWNKSDFNYYTDGSGRKHFLFLFVEYEEAVTILSGLKTTILADTSATQNAKDLITSALGYVQNRGKKCYTGKLGTYDGLKMDLEIGCVWQWTAEDGEYMYVRVTISTDQTEMFFDVIEGQITNVIYPKN